MKFGKPMVDKGNPERWKIKMILASWSTKLIIFKLKLLEIAIFFVLLEKSIDNILIFA